MQKVALLVACCIIAAPGQAQDLGSLHCTNPQITASVQQIVSSMSWPFGGGKIKVFKFYNYRDNPEFDPTGTRRDIRPCKVNLLTDRGEFGFVYGLKKIEGDWYILGEISGPED